MTKINDVDGFEIEVEVEDEKRLLLRLIGGDGEIERLVSISNIENLLSVPLRLLAARERGQADAEMAIRCRDAKVGRGDFQFHFHHADDALDALAHARNSNDRRLITAGLDRAIAHLCAAKKLILDEG